MDALFHLNRNPSPVTFFLTQAPDAISAKHSRRPSAQIAEIEAEINKNVTKPFFFSERHVGNQMTHVYQKDPVPASATGSRRIDAKWDKLFPQYVPKDFVKRHSQGMLNKENEDMIQHVFRIFLKNQYYLMEKYNEKGRIGLAIERPQTVAKPEVDYVSIETKEFVLNANLDRLHAMDRLSQMYEDEAGINLADYFDEKPYGGFSLEADFVSENKIIETILTKMNNHGLHSLNLEDMIAFKCNNRLGFS